MMVEKKAAIMTRAVNWLEQIPNQVMRGVETGEGKHVLVFRPRAFDQFNIQFLLLEETVLDGGESGASQVKPKYPARIFVRLPSWN